MMVHSDDKQLADWKKTFAESDIKYDTDNEYREAIHNLVGFFDVLIQMDQQQQATQEEKPLPLLWIAQALS